MPDRYGQKAAQDQRHDVYWSIVSDLVSLIDRTRGQQLIKEAAEAAVPMDGDVAVLDDVVPAHASEATLLSDCNLRLREALHFLLEARTSRRQPAVPAGRVDTDVAERGEILAERVAQTA